VWEAAPTGTGHGVGSGFLPEIDRWGVVFTVVGHPGKEYRGSVSAEDPDNVSQDELRSALNEQLVIAAIEDSKYVWRPAEAISNETGIPVDQVRRILETTSADILVAPEPNKQGFTLYSTRAHYQKNTSFVKRYIDTLESS
jgi:hypothetical protein